MRIINHPLFVMLILGLCIWLAKTVFFQEEKTIVVKYQELQGIRNIWQRQTGRLPTAEEESALINDYVETNLLIQFGLDSGLVHNDPVLINRLAKNIEFVANEQEDDGLSSFEHALTMGMHKSDPVVRRRILLLTEKAIRDSMKIDVPSDDELDRYLTKNVERYQAENRFSFEQILFAGFGGDQVDAKERASNTLASLRELDPEQIVLLGDASLAPRTFTLNSQRRIDSYFGKNFSLAIANLEKGQWMGPIESAIGWHLVKLNDYLPAKKPALQTIRERVESDWYREQKEIRLRDYKRQLRQRYRISVENTDSLSL